MHRNLRRFVGYTCTAIVAAQLLFAAGYVILIADDVAWVNRGAVSGRVSLVERLFPVPTLPVR